MAIFATIASASAWLTGVEEGIQQPEIDMEGYREYVNHEAESDEPVVLDEMNRNEQAEEKAPFRNASITWRF
ncbi:MULTISPECIES: hypothetical protein [unclassified Alcanivorax]|uniref:hypothetical protein n=1 Tax=unclassified Alcanivorax TaxID=2638842 RepID=UPI0012DF5F12|nr:MULTISPECIES: hypothetical protein [unclassified Alcanivorax]